MKAGWQVRKFGEVCELKKGKKPALSVAPANGYKPYLVAKYLRGAEPVEFASVSDKNSISVGKREIIIICDGSNSGETFIGFDGILSSTMAKVVHGVELDNKFLMHFLDSLFEQFNAGKTGSAIPHLDLSALRAQNLPVPPLPEQQRIVGFLDEAFDGIATAKANAEQSLQNARALFESRHHSIFTQLREGWIEKPLGEVCEYVNGKAHEQCINENGQFIVINSKFISSDGEIFKKSDQALLPLQSGDIAMVLSDVPNGKALGPVNTI